MAPRAQEADRLPWVGVRAEMKNMDIPLYGTPEQCDISVVLGGCLENPLPLRGTKVLAIKRDEWQMVKWEELYGQILEEYYDHIIDTTGLDAVNTLKLIEKECKDL
jgi:hypothetical protein